MKTKTSEAESKYKDYKKIFKRTSRECEATYYKEMFDKKNNSIKQIWKNLNTVCSFKSRSSYKTVSKMISKGVEITAPQEICTEFNHFFSSVGEILIKNSHNLYSPNDISYQKYCAHSVPSSMFCNPVTAAELITIIVKLKNNKAAGPDNIGPALLKEIAPGIIQPFLHIINLSFSTGVFPDNLNC